MRRDGSAPQGALGSVAAGPGADWDGGGPPAQLRLAWAQRTGTQRESDRERRGSAARKGAPDLLRSLGSACSRRCGAVPDPCC